MNQDAKRATSGVTSSGPPRPAAGVSIGTTIVVALLSGALGGVATAWVRKPAAETKPPSAARISALNDEVRELASDVADLDARLKRLQQQRAAPIAPGTAAPAEAPRPDDEALQAAVRAAMDKVQEERSAAREERRTQAVQAWADRLAEKAKLTEQQSEKVASIARDLVQDLREMRDSDAGAPGGGETWMERRNALRDRSEQRLATVLDAHQMEVYRESPELRIDTALRGARRRGGGQ